MERITEQSAKLHPKDFEVNLAKGIVDIGILTGLSPDEAGKLFVELDDTDSRALSWLYTHFSDADALREAGETLRRKKP